MPTAVHPNQPRGVLPWLVTGLAVVPVALALACLAVLRSGSLPLVIPVVWIPSLGIDLTLYLDGLALQFLLLITGIGAVVLVYGASYMKGQPGAGRLFGLLAVFMAAMIGCVSVDNLLALLVFWELTSITSYLLVGFKHHYAPARRAAQQALLTTFAGGLALLVGFLLLGEIAGTYSIRALIEAAPDLAAHPTLPIALVCVFVGAFTKSAQWPFHFWLPNAMAAPTPVSAYLHSATMVKLGVYLLARLKPAFGDLVMWEFTLVTIGALTAAWAMVLTLRERDLKRILAWSTVAALGTLVLLIGLPGPGAAAATAAFLLAHALYKAPLFFVAGNIDHQTGTRRIDDLSGLARTMPWTALAAALAACSMAGVPLSFGHVAKDLITTAKTEGLSFEWVSYATLAFSALSVAVASVAAVRIFWPLRGSSQPANVHEASVPMAAAPILVAASGIALGIMPSLSQSLLVASAQAMLPAAARPFVELVGPDAPLTGVTVLVFALGAVIFVLWEPLHRVLAAATWLDRYGFASWYDRVLKSVPILARAVTTRLQHGFLPAYLALALTCLAVVVAVAAWAQPSLVVPVWTRPSLAVAAASVLVGVAAIAACAALDAFVMVLVAGLAGVGSAVLALFLGAPDVAFTQFTVEVAFVVVVAAVIRRVQRFSLPSAGVHRRGARALLAVMCGGAVTLLLLMAAAGPLDDSATRYYGDRSVSEAFGRNVVNVVLVDFRALDTLGEVVVILLTLVAALPIVHGLRARAPIDRRQP